MAAGCYPVTYALSTRVIRYYRELKFGYVPGKTFGEVPKAFKFHFPEGFGVSPTSTTELEPLSDHGAPPHARRIAAAQLALPRASRHFSARQTVVDPSFLNPASHILKLCLRPHSAFKFTCELSSTLLCNP